jgi:phospholipid-translocating ATPase
VVIDGPALTLALLPGNRAHFLELALLSATVLVCRSSPLQKAMVVELVKAGVPCVTLAVYVAIMAASALCR